jgi:hypothetical protein
MFYFEPLRSLRGTVQIFRTDCLFSGRLYGYRHCYGHTCGHTCSDTHRIERGFGTYAAALTHALATHDDRLHLPTD